MEKMIKEWLEEQLRLSDEKIANNPNLMVEENTWVKDRGLIYEEDRPEGETFLTSLMKQPKRPKYNPLTNKTFDNKD
jgi:hypothetical protein